MIATANYTIGKQGKLWRLVSAAGAWFQALDYTGLDYTEDRIDLLERKVAMLTEEVRESRASSPRVSVPHS